VAESKADTEAELAALYGDGVLTAKEYAGRSVRSCSRYGFPRSFSLVDLWHGRNDTFARTGPRHGVPSEVPTHKGKEKS